jgi:hypothetical protein
MTRFDQGPKEQVSGEMANEIKGNVWYPRLGPGSVFAPAPTEALPPQRENDALDWASDSAYEIAYGILSREFLYTEITDRLRAAHATGMRAAAFAGKLRIAP